MWNPLISVAWRCIRPLQVTFRTACRASGFLLGKAFLRGIVSLSLSFSCVSTLHLKSFSLHVNDIVFLSCMCTSSKTKTPHFRMMALITIYTVFPIFIHHQKMSRQPHSLTIICRRGKKRLIGTKKTVCNENIFYINREKWSISCVVCSVIMSVCLFKGSGTWSQFCCSNTSQSISNLSLNSKRDHRYDNFFSSLYSTTGHEI